MSQDHPAAEIDVARLRAIPLLAELDEPLLAEAARWFVVERFPADTLVIREGEPGDRFYLIVRGKVGVTRTTASGEVQQLAVLQDGDHFGEIALLKDVPRGATVCTLTPTVLLSLQRAQLLELLHRAPRLREQVEAIQAARLAGGSSGSGDAR